MINPVIQTTWESLNGVLYDLEKGDLQDALTTIQDLIEDLENAGANQSEVQS